MNNKQKYTIENIMQIMKDLRTPKTGYHLWDKEQTFGIIIEEAYEIANAIDRRLFPSDKGWG